LRIAIISNSYLPQLGGLEIAVSHIAGSLAKCSHKVTVITPSHSFGYTRETDPRNFEVHRLPFFTPRLVTVAGKKKLLSSVYRSIIFPMAAPVSFIKLLEILKHARPDVVNLHYVGDIAPYCLLACRRLNLKCIVSLHGNDIEGFHVRSAFSRLLTRTTLSRADRVFTNSRDLLDQALVIEPSIKDKSRVMRNGIDLVEFRNHRPFKHSKPYLLNIANFIQKKGQDILIGAFARLCETVPDIDLLLVGDGPTRTACVELAVCLGVYERIRFMGKLERERIPSIVAGCKVFALSSRKEPFGIVLLEAMAMSRPIVATRVGGIPEIIEHERNGILVDPDDVEQFANAISLLLQRPDWANDMGNRAYQDVTERFDWSVIIQDYIEEYAAMLGG